MFRGCYCFMPWENVFLGLCITKCVSKKHYYFKPITGLMEKCKPILLFIQQLKNFLGRYRCS